METAGSNRIRLCLAAIRYSFECLVPVLVRGRHTSGSIARLSHSLTGHIPHATDRRRFSARRVLGRWDIIAGGSRLPGAGTAREARVAVARWNSDVRRVPSAQTRPCCDGIFQTRSDSFHTCAERTTRRRCTCMATGISSARVPDRSFASYSMKLNLASLAHLDSRDDMTGRYSGGFPEAANLTTVDFDHLAADDF